MAKKHKQNKYLVITTDHGSVIHSRDKKGLEKAMRSASNAFSIMPLLEDRGDGWWDLLGQGAEKHIIVTIIPQ